MQTRPGFAVVQRLLPRPMGVLLCALLAACGGGGGGGAPAPAPVDNGISFAPPTSTQLAAVTQEWASRDLAAREASVVHTDDSSPLFQVRVVRHLVGANVHYGALVIPKHAAGGGLAVTLEVDGLDQGNPSMDVTRWLARNRADAASALIVLPVFRGRTLRLGSSDWRADGDFCDAYDGATDDAIALLNVAQQQVPEADFSRVLARGGSRGGTVALLLGQRDPRVSVIATGSAAVDFYRRDVANLYASQFACHFINGKTPAQSVQRMLASSPLHHPMLGSVTRVYIDHGDADPVVPLWNANEMAARLRERGAPLDLKIHAGAVHDLTMYASYRERQQAIFAAHLGR